MEYRFPARRTAGINGYLFDLSGFAKKLRGLIIFVQILKRTVMSLVSDFNDYRAKMNDRILGHENKVMRRFYNLDSHAYEEGALPVKTKEMLGLIASMVLRCDDCIKYHIGKCKDLDMSEDEFFEILSIANLVGGSICIPHTRRAVEYWDALHAEHA